MVVTLWGIVTDVSEAQPLKTSLSMLVPPVITTVFSEEGTPLL